MSAADLGRAGACLDQARQALRDLRNDRALATLLLDVAEHARLTGAPVDARRSAQEAACLARKSGDRRTEAQAMIRLAEAHLDENEYERATIACRKAAGLLEGAGLPRLPPLRGVRGALARVPGAPRLVGVPSGPEGRGGAVTAPQATTGAQPAVDAVVAREAKSLGHSLLEFGCYLEFGFWDLEFDQGGKYG